MKYNEEMLKMQTMDHRLKSHAVWYIRTQTKGLDYTKAMLQALSKQAHVAV